MRKRRGLAVMLVSMLILGACGQDEPEEAAPQPEEERGPDSVELRAAPNEPEDPNIAILEFLPEKIAVKTGADVTWNFRGPEPHSVTFFPAGQTPPPPGEDPRLFEGLEPSGPVDGSTLINSGLRPTGPEPPEPFEVTFDKAGTFNYVCVIHPLMTGEVTVTDDAESADTQEEITERGDEEYEQWLEDGRGAKERLLAAPPRSTTEGGTTTYIVQMGATTEHADVLSFAPADPSIKPGDRVTFLNNSGAPHTATFAGGATVPQDPESAEAMNAAPGPSPQTLTATGLFNTGWLPPNAPPGAGPPEAARSYTYVVPEAGEYKYVCLLHVPSGMAGTIKVA